MSMLYLSWFCLVSNLQQLHDGASNQKGELFTNKNVFN